MKPFLTHLICLGVLAVPTVWADEKPAGPAHAPYLETLKASGVEPSGEGALVYLRELHPSPERLEAVEKLIAALGSARWSEREAASRTLSRMPNLPVEPLTRAIKGDNPEVRWRARQILREQGGKSAAVIYAAYRTIAAERPKQAVGVVLASLPYCTQHYLLAAALDALRLLAGPTDAAQLRTALAGDDQLVRRGAAAALCASTPKAELEGLAQLLGDTNDHVTLEAVQVLADAGDRRCLATLLRLLDATEIGVRSAAVGVLRGLTGQNNKYAAYEAAAERAPAIAKWRAWIAGAGQTAKLTFPVPRRMSARGDLRGNTLVSTGQTGQIRELDPSGKVVWSYPLAAWSAEKLTNGNVLIASYTTNKVVEVDASKKVVWQYDKVNAMTAKPLMNGNILVADFRGKRVVEINPQKKIVWETKAPQECFDADRLPNGNTMFGCPNHVKEVTPDHKVVREWKIEGRLNGFQALPNGNVLVANYGKSEVVELTPDGKRVWELKETQPCDVFRLPNGNTLVSTAKRIIEVSPDKQVVKEICAAKYGSARR